LVRSSASGKILQQDSTVATGAGHHSVLHAEGSPNWYIVYHRRPLGETDRNHRVVSIDELRFDADGKIQPVKITKDGVKADTLRNQEVARGLQRDPACHSAQRMSAPRDCWSLQRND
jgi:hypothetical protein